VKLYATTFLRYDDNYKNLLKIHGTLFQLHSFKQIRYSINSRDLCDAWNASCGSSCEIL